MSWDVVIQFHMKYATFLDYLVLKDMTVHSFRNKTKYIEKTRIKFISK